MNRGLNQAMNRGWFIAGTDTGVGKTLVATALVQASVAHGFQTVVMKPVSAGCESTPEGLRNGDALKLLDAANVKADYELVNPYAFEPAIAPHIAAAQIGVSMDQSRIDSAFDQLNGKAEKIVIEGAGGWRVPLTEDSTMAQLAQGFGLPVILVVGLRLGCLNHGLLTYEAIQHDGLKCIGWVGNVIDSHYKFVDENIKTLKDRFACPCLGVIPHMKQDIRPENVHPHVQFSQLLENEPQVYR